MSVVVVATILPKPGKLEEVASLMRSAIPDVHGEEGCEMYALHQGDDQLVMIERWASREALRRHGGGESLKALGAQLRELVTGRMDVVVLDPLPAGDADKGIL